MYERLLVWRHIRATNKLKTSRTYGQAERHELKYVENSVRWRDKELKKHIKTRERMKNAKEPGIRKQKRKARKKETKRDKKREERKAEKAKRNIQTKKNYLAFKARSVLVVT